MREILLVEDDSALLSILHQRFSEEGYEVSTANSIRAAKIKLREKSYDLAVIDIGLPDGDGFSIAQEINATRNIPYIFLTAMSSPEFRLEGYELGASDYIPKPFHFKELKLRVEKILGMQSEKKLITTPGLTLNSESYTLQREGEDPVTIGIRESELLSALISESPRVLSRDEIVNTIWDMKESTNLRAVDNCIVKLRDLLGQGLSVKIRSVRGAGYQWL